MMRINKKGQALVEFIIILPIFIFMMFMIIDYGMISYNKNKMENIMNNVDKMNNKETQEEIEEYIKKNDSDVKINIKNNGKYKDIELSKKYTFYTPGLGRLIKDYKIKIERTIYNE